MQNVATALGLCAVFLFVMSYQMKKRRGIIFVNALSRVFYVLQYLFLGAFSGALLDAVGFAVSLLCGRSDRGFVQKHRFVTILLSDLGIVLAGMLTYRDLYSLLPIFGVLFETLALWLKKESKIRAASLLGAPFWLIYNLHSGAYGSVLGNGIVLVSLFIAIVRYDVLGKEKKAS